VFVIGWDGINPVQISKTVGTVLFRDQDGIEVLVVSAVSCGVIHYLHCVDVGH